MAVLQKAKEYLGSELEKAERPAKRTFRQKALMALAVFMALMLFLTVLSTIADSFTVPKVSTARGQKGNLEFQISGSGTLVSARKEFIYGIPGLRIRETLIVPGEKVTAGQPVASVDLEDLKGRLKEAEISVQKLSLQLEQAGLSAGGTVLLSADSAETELEYLQKDLELAEEELNSARKILAAAVSKSEAEGLAAKQKALEEADFDYKTFLLDWEAAEQGYEERVNSAKQKVEAQKDFKRMVDNISVNSDGEVEENSAYDSLLRLYLQGDYAQYCKEREKLRSEADYFRLMLALEEPGSEEYGRLKQKLTQKIEALSALLERTAGLRSALEYYKSGRASLDAVYTAVFGAGNYHGNAAQKAYEAVLAELESARLKAENTKKEKQEALAAAEADLEAVRNGVYDFEKEAAPQKLAVEAAEQQVQSLQKSVRLAEIRLEQARLQDSETLQSRQNARRSAELTCQSIGLDLELSQGNFQALSELLKNDGVLYSEIDGTVEALYVSAGDKIDDRGIASIGVGTPGFEAELSPESAGYLEEGDVLSLRLKGRSKPIEATVTGVSITSQGNGRLFASLPFGEEAVGGAVADFSISKRSGLYDLCLPVSAVRQDADGYYALVAEEAQSFLGAILKARRVDITVVESDGFRVAVEGDLSDRQDVIVYSNKTIGDNDRVRLLE